MLEKVPDAKLGWVPGIIRQQFLIVPGNLAKCDGVFFNDGRAVMSKPGNPIDQGTDDFAHRDGIVQIPHIPGGVGDPGRFAVTVDIAGFKQRMGM
jgi:hypothetical protein